MTTTSSERQMTEITDDLPTEIHDEVNGLHYTLVGDYYLPSLVAPTKANYTPDIWARKRLRYLKGHKHWLYIELLTSGQLNTHLEEIDERAAEWLYRLPQEIAEREGVTDDMKRDDPMRWVGLMNNIYSHVRELIDTDIIYA